MVFVSTNGGALTARYHARLTGANSSKAVQMLASGARINGAGDDAAGLAVASKMKSQLRGLHAAMLNTSQGISLLQTAAEGMQTAEKLVQRIRELAVQSHNGTYTDNDRMNLQFEADSLLNQLAQNVEGTKFNDINLIDKYTPSRSEMVLAALEHRHARYIAHVFDDLPLPGPAALESVIISIDDWMAQEAERGCLFHAAVAAAPRDTRLRDLLRQHKSDVAKRAAIAADLADRENDISVIIEGLTQSWPLLQNAAVTSTLNLARLLRR